MRKKNLENLPEINNVEKQAYIDLTKYCCSVKIQKKLVPFFRNLKDFSTHDFEYLTTLNYVINYFDKFNIFFIMSLDWKQDIETLEWRFKNSLKENFNLSIELPSPSNSQKNLLLDVFADYDNILREKELQVSFIDTESDEYVFMIHKISKSKEIERLINDLGYNYYDLKTKNSSKNQIVVKEKIDRYFFVFLLIILILCPLFTNIVYKKYIKDGISFMVLFVAIFNLIFYYFSISVLWKELKKER